MSLRVCVPSDHSCASIRRSDLVSSADSIGFKLKLDMLASVYSAARHRSSNLAIVSHTPSVISASESLCLVDMTGQILYEVPIKLSLWKSNTARLTYVYISRADRCRLACPTGLSGLLRLSIRA